MLLVAMMMGTYALSLTWTSCHITMTAGSATGNTVRIEQFRDCNCLLPITTIDWDGVTQGNCYEHAVYVRNTGTEAVYLTYLPTFIGFEDNQTKFWISCYIIEFGLPCETYPVPPFQLPEKDVDSPVQGFWLLPGKVVKIDIILYVESIVAGHSYTWDFAFYGAKP